MYSLVINNAVILESQTVDDGQRLGNISCLDGDLVTALLS